MTEKTFYRPRDVMEIMGVQHSTACKLIRDLNKELKKEGYITIQGRVSKRYFDERVAR